MQVLFLGFAVLLFLLLALGWVLVLVVPWLAVSAATAGGAAEGVAHLRRTVLTRESLARSGLLCLEGLSAVPAAAARLRGEIGRVLELGDPEARPRACSCVREHDGAFVGVLRVFDTRGHYLQRVRGADAAAVAAALAEDLGRFPSDFPAREGTRRQGCPECRLRTCPLRRPRRAALAA